jgi:hypothetical protein
VQRPQAQQPQPQLQRQARQQQQQQQQQMGRRLIQLCQKLWQRAPPLHQQRQQQQQGQRAVPCSKVPRSSVQLPTRASLPPQQMGKARLRLLLRQWLQLELLMPLLRRLVL